MSDIDQRVQGVWREAWAFKERANRHCFYSQREATNAHAGKLVPLDVGAKVFVQNQHGNRYNRGNFTQFLLPGADRRLWTSGEEDPAASAKILTA